MKLDKIGQLILSKDLETALMDVKMGIEVEMHRVFKNGKLSNHGFPEELGEQEKNRRIKNDFFNMQSEIITPTAANAAEAIRDLTALNYSLRSALKEDEVLWPLSLPPILPENLNTLEISHVSPEKEKYYHEWLSKHDIRRALPTG
ncbi:MAG: glutamate--cysteine ligase, partial [Leuconostoc suionicum]